ncbi:hypothetical protein EJB05_31506, partial [Eragrostis curvula]
MIDRLSTAITSVEVGNGATTSFWFDDWTNLGPLHLALPAAFSHCTDTAISVRKALHTGILTLPLRPRLSEAAITELNSLCSSLSAATLEDRPDERWIRGTESRTPTSKSMYSKISPPGHEIRLQQHNWDNFAPKKVQVFFWILRHGNTRTRSFLHSLGVVDTKYCPFCPTNTETIDHLFVSCPAIQSFWHILLGHTTDTIEDWCSLVVSKFSSWPVKTMNTLLLALLWIAWKRRNRMIFDGINLTTAATATLLAEHLRLWTVRAPPSVSTVTMEDWCSLEVDVGLTPTVVSSKKKKNTFTGAIPASLGNLSSLYYLEVALNHLEGTIPSSLGNIQRIQYLNLACNNLSGEPPLSLYNLSSLRWLQLQENMLHGGIPADIGNRLPSILVLGFYSNYFTGPIPASLSNLTTLHTLDLSNNSLSGYVPRTLGRLHALGYLDLDTNRLEANDNEGWKFLTSLSNCTQLNFLDFSSNAAFTGQLPSSIANLSTNLQTLSFADTGISGSIPSAIGNLVSLQILRGQNTFISGVIPESIGKLGNLTKLLLFNTNLSEQIPSSIGNLSNLIQLDAHHANLEGSIPASIGKMKNLNILDLSRNRLNGSISEDIFKLSLLSICLNLSNNSLSGPIPSEVGNLDNLNKLALSGNQLSGEILDTIGHCTVLQELWLDNNSFTGSIPQSLSNIKGLSVINLSMNSFSGSIPGDIGSIQNLQLVYLARNNLSGSIPIGLHNLTSMSKLDLSFNNLQGEVPKEGIFRNLTHFSINGNNDLCAKINRKRHLKSLTIALASTGAHFFLATIIGLIKIIHYKLRRKQKIPFLPPIVEEQCERVSYQTLANGTNGFSEDNLIGKGSFGAVYKCTFQEQGITAAVKVFNIEHSSSAKSFVAECEVLRMVRHRCLIKIITCCSSIDHQGQDFKALVFEFMPNGSLSDWLYPKSSMPTLGDTLNLEQRLDIAVDIVDAFGLSSQLMSTTNNSL